MILIFEGPDGVGKTTLFKALAKSREYKDTYIDRMFISDCVYAIMREDDETLLNKSIELRKFNKEFYPVYIFVSADNVNIQKALNDKGENAVYENIKTQNIVFKYAYDMLLSDHSEKMKIDRTGKSIDECVRLINKELKKYEDTI
ncbi:MAG: hypothetical protein ACYDBV_13140 [Nitrospiria bacterium]